jgi:hypothetical protein
VEVLDELLLDALPDELELVVSPDEPALVLDEPPLDAALEDPLARPPAPPEPWLVLVALVPPVPLAPPVPWTGAPIPKTESQPALSTPPAPSAQRKTQRPRFTFVIRSSLSRRASPRLEDRRPRSPPGGRPPCP